LFANKNAQEDIILEPYEDYVDKFKDAVSNLLSITPDIDSVDMLETEDDEAKFIQAFREIMRIKNVLECFTEFSFDDLPMNEQLFADFRSKYLDLYDKVKGDNAKEKVSILDDIDFEIELIRRDKINVSYIIGLLLDLKDKKPSEQAKARKNIMDILDTETQLRSKKELIEQFISKHFADIPAQGNVSEAFDTYWSEEKQKAITTMRDEEGLDREGLERILSSYLFTEKTPMRDEVIEIMEKRPSLKDRSTVAERVISRIKDFVEIFIDGVD
jgi:type I restriction enzyme R subunit